MKNLIFLDIDGVLNCQLSYGEYYKEAKKKLKKGVKSGSLSQEEYYRSQLCPHRMGWFNELCKDVDAGVIISSTWRHNPEVNQILADNGALFNIIGHTPVLHVARGVEIERWLEDNVMALFGVQYYDFYRYAIIDDDSDMLLSQASHFFQTDNYSGLTPTTCYRIKRFFTHKTF